MIMQSRKQLLEVLLEYRNPSDLKEVLLSLSRYEWDVDESLVTVTGAVLRTLLQRYIRGELTADQVHEWGDAVEMREDIDFGYQGQGDEIVQDIVFKIATPELEGMLTPERAHALVESLENVR